MNAKIQGWSTPFGQKKGGGQLQTKNIIGTLAYNLCLYSLYFIRYMGFFIEKAFQKTFDHICRKFYIENV